MKLDLTQPWTGRVDVASVCRNPDQPRVTFDHGALKRLGTALTKRQQQPCRVIPHTDEHRPEIRWMLVDGERRWRAAQEVKLAQIWVCYEPGVDAGNLHESSLAANFNREGHTKMETARALQKEIDDGKTIEDLAELLGWSESSVRNYLSLLSLHADMQALLDHQDKSRRIPLRVALALAQFPKDKQRHLYEKHGQGKREGEALSLLRVNVGIPTSRRSGDDNRFVVGRLRAALGAVKNLNLMGEMVSRLSPDKAAEAIVMCEQIRAEVVPLKMRLDALFGGK